jgi:hypothetical protein
MQNKKNLNFLRSHVLIQSSCVQKGKNYTIDFNLKTVSKINKKFGFFSLFLSSFFLYFVL